MPKVRRDAVNMAKKRGVRISARYYGVSPGTVSKWMKRAPSDGRMIIPTVSSRPNTNPNALPRDIVEKIIEVRLKNGRCSEVVHKVEMAEMGTATIYLNNMWYNNLYFSFFGRPGDFIVDSR
jgi:transposase-like protein